MLIQCVKCVGKLIATGALCFTTGILALSLVGLIFTPFIFLNGMDMIWGD